MIRLSLAGVLTLGLLWGCASEPPVSIPDTDRDGAPARTLDPNAIPDAVPRPEPKSRYGNPASYVVFGNRYEVMEDATGFSERGIASWYGTKFHGRRTSSGEPYDMYQMTAAHKSLPLPSYVRVTNLRNGRQAVVKVNDRGPFHANRIIDLSYAAATKLGILAEGTGFVEITLIDPKKTRPATNRQPPPVKAPELFIQVGAFSERGNAEGLKRRLDGSIEQEVRIHPMRQGEQTLYRVQVGPLRDVTHADALTDRLARLNIRETRLVLAE